jgi:hypothetical protein
MFETLLRWNLRHRWVGLCIALAIAFIGISRGINLPIRLSLADLLPETRESVKDLEAVSEEVGGVGYLIVLVGPTENPEKLLAPIAEKLSGNKEIKYTFHEREAYLLRDKALYLLPEREFEDLLGAGRVILSQGKKGLIDLGLESEAEKRTNLRKAKQKLSRFGKQEQSRYYLSKDKRYARRILAALANSLKACAPLSVTISQHFPLNSLAAT